MYFLLSYSLLFLSFFHKSVYSGSHVRERAEIIIEGFPRSANTFSVLAFTLTLRRNVFVTSHFHAEAKVLQGVKFGIPVIVLIRHPVDALPH